MTQDGRATLRERQTAATREEILDVAMDMLSKGAADGFSHESIAAAAGMGARTVYRHFPDRGQLLEALWVRLRDATNTRFPTREEEIVTFVRAGFREFDAHETLVRAVLSSPAGTEVRERGGAEGRPAFAQSLNGLLTALKAKQRARVVAVFVAVYSAPFWQLLRDRGGLTGPEAQEATAWMLGVLLDALREDKNSKPKRSEKDASREKQKNGRPRR
jgi:AcrR family transcriptional regulator